MFAWAPAGPTAIFGGQTENIPGNRVSGAVNSLLLHPTDANRAWIGTVNGGIWTTSNLTAAEPNWTARTDEAGSLSIGALTSDLADPSFNQIWAGVGRFSSLGSDGGTRTGLLRSVDSGSTWVPITGGGTLVGKNISGLYVQGNTIVVGANVADSFTTDNVGLFRSTNGGSTFTQLNGAPGTGLPIGVSYDLVFDPINPNTLYASIWNQLPTDGIYKSINAGATWSIVSDATMQSFIGNSTSNMELSVGRNNNIYVGIINQGILSGLFRSGNGGGTWAQLDLPTTNENGSAIGLHPRPKGPGLGAEPAAIAGGQGAIHFSIAADPVDHNVVYLGGDRQPIPQQGQPNSIGATDFAGRLFRVNASLPSGSQFISLTHNPTTNSNSAPHADSRDMAVAANGWLIEVNDGGIVKRTNPRTTGDWFPLTGNLQNTEFHSVAYDSLSNVVFGGAQDVGTPVQRLNSTSWDSLTTADGGVVEIDNQSRAALNQSVRYTSFQQFGGFRKTIYDASNQVISTTFPGLVIVGTGQTIKQRDQSLPFYTPIVLNAVDKTRSLVLSNSIYESFDQFETLFSRGSGTSPFLASAYGGAGNADVIYVANGSGFFVRTTASGFFNQITQYTGQTAVDMALDPDDWRNGVIVDRNRVFLFTNAGATVTEGTGNLGSLIGNAKIRTVVYLPRNTTDSIIVGTDIGTFIMDLATPNQWRAYSPELPNAPVMDLRYDRVDDVLIAGTLGRGAWKFTNASSNNAPPVIASIGLAVTYTENAPRVLVFPSATITDPDTVNFANAVLTITNTNGQSTDSLAIVSTASIAASGANVLFNGTIIGTFTGGGGTIPLAVTFNNQASSARVQLVMNAVGFANSSDAPGTNARSISVRVTDGVGGISALQSKLVNVVAVNDAPVIGNIGAAVTFNPNGPRVLVFQTATINDVDTNIFANAVLTITNTNGQAGDSLAIIPTASITLSGSNVLFNGTIIGTFTGGVSTTPLVVTFNNQASFARVQLVLNAVGFASSLPVPNTTARTISVRSTDGLGGTSLSQSKSVNVNLPPVIGSVGAASTFSVNGPRVLIFPNATIFDPNTVVFTNGVLTVINTNGQATDSLAIIPTASITVSGVNVLFNGTIIGSFTGGGGTTPLTFTFNNQASFSRVQLVLNAIGFASSLAAPTTTARTVSVRVTDGVGGTSTLQSKLVNINQIPVIGSIGAAATFVKNGPRVLVFPTATITDPNTVNFANAVLTVTNTNGQATDSLAIIPTASIIVSGANVLFNGTIIGSFTGGAGTTPLAFTFNNQASFSRVQLVLNSIGFASSSAAPITTARTITVRVTDGIGGTSALQSKLVNII